VHDHPFPFDIPAESPLDYDPKTEQQAQKVCLHYLLSPSLLMRLDSQRPLPVSVYLQRRPGRYWPSRSMLFNANGREVGAKGVQVFFLVLWSPFDVISQMWQPTGGYYPSPIVLTPMATHPTFFDATRL
jgi:hypothetical protein